MEDGKKIGIVTIVICKDDETGEQIIKTVACDTPLPEVVIMLMRHNPSVKKEVSQMIEQERQREFCMN